MGIEYLCRFFMGHLPCSYHKAQGAICDSCRHFSPKTKKILIIKLLAIGDVLRTTFVLKPLKDKFKDCHITWLAHHDAKPLLANNDLIDEVIEYDLDAVARLLVERYDIVINPSNEKESAILATLAKAKRKLGFIYNEAGYIEPLGKMAKYYLEMGINDDLKKQNRLTYQQIVSGMIGLRHDGSKPNIVLNAEEIAFADRFRHLHNLVGKFVVGLNINSGKRWQLKKWALEKTVELAKRLYEELKVKVVLFGGPGEDPANKEIMRACSGALVDAGCRNSLKEFVGLMDLIDVLITSDSLGLHIATALDKHVIALFGPTSPHEVELYNRGVKIMPEGMDCLSCYKNTCSIKPNCMDRIGIREVLSAVEKFKNGIR